MNCPRHTLSPQGPDLSRIVAGLWRIGDWGMSPPQRLDFIAQCLALGVTTFDQADIYGDYTAEALLGEALALAPSIRQRMEIVTKCGIKLVSPRRPEHGLKHYDTSSAHITASVEQSLVSLRTDYLDVLLIHRPDPLMDFDDMAHAFTQLKQAGKVRHFGVSNFSRHQFDCLHKRFPLVTNQVEFSPLCLTPLQDQTFDGLQDQGIAPMVWSPLAGGQLFKSDTPATQRLQRVIAATAAELAQPFASVVYAWIMQLPSRPLPLTGSGRIAALVEAVQATQFTLSRQQWFSILAAASGHEVA